MSADGRAVLPTSWLFGLRCPSTETYRLLSGARSPYQGSKVSASDSSQSSHRPLLCLPSAFMTPERARVTSLPLQETLQDRHCDKIEKIQLGENKIWYLDSKPEAGLPSLKLGSSGHRHKSPLTRNQHKQPNQHFPPQAKTKRKK